MNPYDTYIERNGKHIKKTYVLYIDDDGEKLCDGCDEKKKRVASIKMVTGGVECLCQDCIKDILKIWD